MIGRALLLGLCFIYGLTAAPSLLTAQVITSELDKFLASAEHGSEISVIVQFRRTATPALMRGGSRAAILRALRRENSEAALTIAKHLSGLPSSRSKRLWLINGLALNAGPALIRRLASLPEIRQIRSDRRIKLMSSTESSSDTPALNLQLLNVPALWQLGFDGSGVTIASMDTGLDPLHPALAGKLRANGWFDPNGEHSTPHDADGHGTQTAGILVGGVLSGTAIGAAPGARLVAAKIFDDSGIATFSNIHLAFQWLLDPDGNPDTNDAPDVVNASWGLVDGIGICSMEFAEDLEALRAAGIAVVFAAGNDGPGGGTSISPANNPSSFSCGAVDLDGTILASSSRGPSACNDELYPKVVAPGLDIKTSDLTFGGLFPDASRTVSGTSFAAAHAAGLIALLIDAFPDKTLEEREAAITATASDLGDSGPDNSYGHGLIDGLRAYQFLAALPLCTDADGDGYFGQPGCATTVDCNDQSAAVYPGAAEIRGDGTDQDCDGTDLACTDNDGDGFSSDPDCGTHLDCNDADPAIHFGAPEVMNDGIDQDCNGVDLLCTDQDGDGYFIEPACAAVPDCNDSNRAISPGATERKRDKIDQDCNGYDLSIDIVRAVYLAKSNKLEVEAKSSLRSVAQLEVKSFGAMQWDPRRQRWMLSISMVTAPSVVEVSGIEGITQKPVRILEKR